jgi:hypothetical protein
LKLVGWLALSLGVHAAALAVLALGLLPIERWSAEVQPEPIAFEIISPLEPEPEPALPEPEPPPQPEPQPEETPEPPPEEPPEPQVAAARLPNPTLEPLPETTLPESGEPATESTMELPEIHDATPPRLDPAEERRRMAALLDPSAVARSGFDFGPGPSQRGAPAGLGPSRDSSRPSEQELERSLSSGLRAEAMTKRHLEHEPFRLQRRPDGTQAWVGPRLTGVIHPDGSVTFEDQGNVQTNGFSASGTFDLTEAIMGASGQDPLRAERDYFMRHTEELRGRLEAAHRRQEMERGLRTLPGRLDRVWATTSRSPASRRRHIFELWDEMASDESGRRARAIVIEWIRQQLPEASADAYTAAEHGRLNARRQSKDRDAHYD